MKLNFLIIFLAYVYAINVFAQADKTIPNRALDGDLKLQVNDGGVATDALTIDGASGNATLSSDLSVSGNLNVTGTDKDISITDGQLILNGNDKGITVNTGDIIVQGANTRIDYRVEGSLANGASLPNMEIASGGLLYSGTIHAFCMVEGAGFANQTYKMIHSSGRGNTALFTVIDQHDRGSGCSFTVTRPVDRFITLTNTSGSTCACGISYFGLTI